MQGKIPVSDKNLYENKHISNIIGDIIESAETPEKAIGTADIEHHGRKPDGSLKKLTRPKTENCIRLVFIPAVVFAGCWLANIDSVVAGVSVTLAAMPAGTTTAILAMKYHGDEEFATQCVVLTTMLSMAAIPIWSLIIHSVL